MNNTSFSKSNWAKSFSDNQFILIHVFALFFTFFVFRFLGLITEWPEKNNLLFWDFGWYNSIKIGGYHFSDIEQSNSGFFPLFPYIWRMMGLNLLQMSIFNGLLALFSVAVLRKAYHFELRESLLCLSFPSMLFLYVPYSESFFFFFSSVFLMGLKQRNNFWIAFGLVFASMTRSTAVFFIPAILFMELFSAELNRAFLLQILKNILFYLSCIAVGISVVVFIQFYETGVWFAYFKAQSLFWHHFFAFPGFPLATWDGVRLIWLDGLAFFVGLLASGLSIWVGIKWLLKKYFPGEAIDKSYLFSLFYLSMVFCGSVFFNPSDPAGSTHIYSINRYMFVCPFLIIFLHHHFNAKKLNGWQLVALVIFTFSVWLMFGSGADINVFYYFTFVSVYILFFYLMLFHDKFKDLWIPVYCLNIILQLWLFNCFMRGLWVG